MSNEPDSAPEAPTACCDLTTVERVFCHERIVALTAETLGNWQEATEAQRQRLHKLAEDLRQQVCAAAAAVLDPDDLATTLCHLYVRCKSSWIIANNRINYALMVRGELLEELAYEAALLGQMLTLLDPLLDGDRLQRIERFLAAPGADDPTP